jgi:hypothetical protein
MPKVINVLLVYHAATIGPSCFSITKVGFITLEFVAVVQI